MSPNDSDIQRRARDLYVRASRDVDPVMAGRLRAARRTALAAPHASAARRLLLPAGAFAVVAMATLMAWQPGSQPGEPSSTAISADAEPNDLPPDADSADPALYQNLQFYSWLASTDTHSERR